MRLTRPIDFENYYVNLITFLQYLKILDEVHLIVVLLYILNHRPFVIHRKLLSSTQKISLKNESSLLMIYGHTLQPNLL